MSVSPIIMMVPATASAPGAGATDLAPQAAEAFGAMVALAEAGTTAGQTLPAGTKTTGKTSDTLPADSADTDTTAEDGGVASDLLAGAALYLIQPQPVATGHAEIGADTPAGSSPSTPVDIPTPFPVAPPPSGETPEAAPAPLAAATQAPTDLQTAAMTALPPAAASLPKAETNAAANPGPGVKAPYETPPQVAATPAPVSVPAPVPVVVKTDAKPPATANTAAPVSASPDDSQAVATSAAAAAAVARSAATSAAQQTASALHPAAARSSIDKAAAPPLAAATAVSGGETPAAPVDDAPVAVAPPGAGQPLQAPSVMPAPAPLRASNAAASDKTLSAVVSTQGSTEASADTPAAAVSAQVASVAPGVVAAAPTTPTVPAGSSVAPDPALALLPDVLATAAPDSQGSASAAPTTASVDTVAAVVSQSLSSLSRATIETTAQIAAQITRRLEGRSTRFEMKLAPEGLGNVDVSLDIGADGQLAARLAFDNPLAATELRGRADELRRQLEDAGFTLARDALDFAERDPSSSGGGDGFDRRQNSRAFADASRLAAQAEAAVPPPAAWVSLSLTPRGVDMKV